MSSLPFILASSILLLAPAKSAATATASFHARVTASGCPVSVLDLGPSSEVVGERILAAEPLMCITVHPSELTPCFDPVLRRTYLSVPVLLMDSEFLSYAARLINRPGLGQIKSANIIDVDVIDEAQLTPLSSRTVALDFVWTPPRPIGFLWLGCRSEERCEEILGSRQTEAIESVLLSATLSGPGDNDSMRFTYRLTVQNQTFSPGSSGSRGSVRPPVCRQLRSVNFVESGNCASQIHQRLDRKGHYVVEPLLCYKADVAPVILADNIRDASYLLLDLLLQDGIVLSQAVTILEQWRPISVEFMRLWRAQAVVDEEFNRRYKVGPLLIAADGQSARVRVHCSNWTDCSSLRCALKTDPIYLWRHIKWAVESTVEDSCVHVPSGPKHSWQIRQDVRAASTGRSLLGCGSTQCKYAKIRRGKEYAVLLQRLNGSVSFQRNWTEYESGFGDETDFWIGLAAAHMLSSSGATLRMELKLWNNTELFGEFTEFRVENSSTKYRMTYAEMLTNRSNIGFDPLARHQGMRFSTMDRDNDANENSCSVNWSRGGWWFNSCYDFYPTGLFPTRGAADYNYMILGDSQRLSLRGVRLMLEVNVCELTTTY